MNRAFKNLGFAMLIAAGAMAAHAQAPSNGPVETRMERADFTYLGSVEDVQRSMDAMVENVHPEWLVWQGDQGFLPLDEVKRQVETFGKKLLPRYK